MLINSGRACLTQEIQLLFSFCVIYFVCVTTGMGGSQKTSESNGARRIKAHTGLIAIYSLSAFANRCGTICERGVFGCMVLRRIGLEMPLFITVRTRPTARRLLQHRAHCESKINFVEKSTSLN